MSLILCLETSSTNCSVALSIQDGKSKNSYGVASALDLLEDDTTGYSHGEVLHVYIDELLKRNNFVTGDLDAVAISMEPGSYTGLRIGTSAAKGLCYALDIPLIAIDTLQALAIQDTTSSDFTIPFLDARRMEVYASVWKKDECVSPVKAVVLDAESFLRFRESGTTTIIGTGTKKFETLLGGSDRTTQFVEVRPTALTMCDLAQEAMKKGDTVDVAYFEPFYLKDFKVK